MKGTEPPSGATAPVQARSAGGDAIDLRPLAAQICARYHGEFPDEEGRYGTAGVQWCMHDNQYLLAWAIQDARDGTVVLYEQVLWLAEVLGARGFPVERLLRNLQIAGEVVESSDALGPLRPDITRVLADAARELAERRDAAPER